MTLARAEENGKAPRWRSAFPGWVVWVSVYGVPVLPSESRGQVGAAEPMISTMLPDVGVVLVDPEGASATQMEPALSTDRVSGLPGAVKIVAQVAAPPAQGRNL